jgi:DNA-binding NarL/FixJ family response regulator
MQMKLSNLSPRRQEIVRSIQEGLSDKEIAVKLGIEPQTVRNHIHLIFQQTGTSGRVALLAHFYKFTEKVA